MNAVMELEKIQNIDSSAADQAVLLEIRDLSISSLFSERKLVNKVNLTLKRGEMLGLAGESGSGKSLTALAVLGLLPSELYVSEGSITLYGKKLKGLSEKELRVLRGREIAYIFQHYQGSFTPFIKIGKQLAEALRSHFELTKKEAKEKALMWLNRVQLPAERIFGSYPHQLSGGQLQRASLASALMLEPALIIADEPTTALDVLTSESILDLLVQLQQELNCGILLISHDLGHLLKRTDSMAVMYGGQIAEKGFTKSIKNNPKHPYTKLLLNARPVLSREEPKGLAAIQGDPGLVASNGCSFSLRCPMAFEKCSAVPAFEEAENSHAAACHAAAGKGMNSNVRS
ncbi:ABC transporter ATP-binding protein [Bacillus sp. V2I10]|uniref:ABC transporter ATP-binding protein n=1 Tax=Bacillus sp. V2I10 TaxID=3042276 RepID=UPI002780C4DE|nr:ABC transporter ATP-binding protein [Bacillus sp. V2I10]MDQ0857941.1 oligopeptide/dipeptide ABC transporter ATP-binding protein [Bacillus sp. V2I10]